MIFDEALAFTMKWEVSPKFILDEDTLAGKISTAEQRKKVGYVDDPLDPGGETKMGISNSAHPELNIKTLTWDQAKAVYLQDYWIRGSCDKLPREVAIAHFDACVNSGISQASKFLQRAVSVNPDGRIGPVTIGSVQSSLGVPQGMIAQRRKFFNELVFNKPTLGRFLNGWINRINDLEKYLGLAT